MSELAYQQYYQNLFTGLHNSQDTQSAIRQQAMDAFMENGFPTIRQEDWKYTNTKKLSKQQFQLAEKVEGVSELELAAFAIADLDAHVIVLVNGHLDTDLSSFEDLPSDVTLMSLSDALQQQATKLHNQFTINNGFTALNTAFIRDGLYLHLTANTVLNKPVHIMHVSTSQPQTMQHVRHVIQIDNNAEIRIIEHYIALEDCAYLQTSLTHIMAGENSQFDHYKIQQESDKAYHIGLLQADCQSHSRGNCFNLDIGGKLVRHDVTAQLNGEGAEFTTNGLYLLHNKQHVDNHTAIYHNKPHTNSNEFFKGILNDASRAVFNGKIIVQQDAQKVLAEQSNKNLLLSGNAEVDTKPQLEIYADDVQCAHGATVGHLDDKALFYLQSRGIDKELAQQALTYGFANDVLETIRLEPVRKYMQNLAMNRIARQEQDHE